MSTIARDLEAIGHMSVVPTILEVMARITDMRFTAVARVTEQTWTACAVRDEIEFGLKPGGELKLETTICNEIRQHGRPVIFGSASENKDFCNHPTPRMYGFESYISIPIFRLDGSFFGTLCAIDPRPAKLDDPNLLRTLELFAQLIALNLETQDKLDISKQDLIDAQDAARLREQFVAVLGHDLRNPIHAINLGAEALERAQDLGEARKIIGVIKRSSRRMELLVEDVLDFARSKLGGGIPIDLRDTPDLAVQLAQLVEETVTAYPGRVITSSIRIEHPVRCDPARIAQMLGNLLANAVVHGGPELPVAVSISTDPQYLTISVANGGDVIPTHQLARLFEPFTRGANGQTRGLGLGLYIASSISKAHQGRLEVTSSALEGTCFRFTMPR